MFTFTVTTIYGSNTVIPSNVIYGQQKADS